ncbi:hypothetical protein PC121_g14583 [Phytophthora cactorum]|nr:hypothetical protein PC120_g13129 [Phytophthora cactorum]KAG3057990.1 hypothetical protein PC121_g14583 [Phytophthora cactorum]
MAAIAHEIQCYPARFHFYIFSCCSLEHLRPRTQLSLFNLLLFGHLSTTILLVTRVQVPAMVSSAALSVEASVREDKFSAMDTRDDLKSR